MVKIIRFDLAYKEEWDYFVHNSKNGTFLFYRDYMDYHSDRFQDYSLLIRNDECNIIALLPAHKHENTLSSHSGLTYGGFITTPKMKTSMMLEVFVQTLAFLKQNHFQEFIYKTIPYIYHKIPSEEDRYALFLCGAHLISRDVLTVVDHRYRVSMQDRRRRGIKKAQSYGLTIRKSEDFDNYWRMVEKLLELRYKEKPVHTIDEIQRLHFLFPKNIKLFACVKKSTMLAGVLIYESDKVAHVQYIASNASGRKLGALDLTFHYLLTDYYRHKPYFDFGISNEDQGHYLNKGLIDQKEGFGARAVVHDQYKIDLLIWEPDKILSASNK